MTQQHVATAISRAADLDQLKAAISDAADLDDLKTAINQLLDASSAPPEEPSPEPDLITIDEACQVLGGSLKISRPSFYELTKQPGFPAAYRLNSRIVRLSRRSLLEFLETTRTTSPPTAG